MSTKRPLYSLFHCRMDGEFRTKGAIMSQFQKNVLFIGAEVIVVMRKLSIISVLLPLIWVLINPGAVLESDAADAAVGNRIDDHIATGRYFLIDLASGQLNVQKSSLKLVTTCQGPVSAWINQCEKEIREFLQTVHKGQCRSREKCFCWTVGIIGAILGNGACLGCPLNRGQESRS